MKVVLVSCASKKLPRRSKARELYSSNLFRLSLRYAQSLAPDKIFILSAKHGLLGLEEEIEPYDETLNRMHDREVREWAERVLARLASEADLQRDEFVFLAGENYRKYLLPKISRFEVPMGGLGIGRKLKFMKERLGK